MFQRANFRFDVQMRAVALSPSVAPAMRSDDNGSPKRVFDADDAADGALSPHSRYGRQGVDRMDAGAVR